MNKFKKILQFIIGLLLLTVALFTMKYTFLIGVFSIIIANTYKKRFIKGLAKIGTIFTAGAYCIDALACVILQVPLNWILITKNGYKFGKKYDTISYVLGRNQKILTLKNTGKKLVIILNWLDENHCLEAVKIRNEYFKLNI